MISTQDWLTPLAFLAAIFVLISFHELGHYCVAKLCGVKVLRFSFGFGKPLFSWRMFDTEWALCPIPLGGYVRMLDSRDSVVPESERARSFNAQSVGRRMAIIAAGPLANLLLAALLYWVVIAHGVVQIRPMVGTVVTDSPAAAAGFQPGERLLSIDGMTVLNWDDARLKLLDATANRDRPLDVVVEAGGVERQRQVDVPRFAARYSQEFDAGDIGLLPERFLPVIGGLEDKGVAMQAGLKVGDRLLAADGKPLTSWQQWVDLIHQSPGKELNLTIGRAGGTLNLMLRPALVQLDDGFIGRIGAMPQMDSAWLNTLQYTQYYDVPQAGWQSLLETRDTIWTSLKFMGRMLIGASSMDNLSGPLEIANMAGQTAQQGLFSYLEFIALISVSIGVLNLLPIPVLDGGHLMYYTAELIRGKPLSERIQMLGQRFGFALLALLMAFAMLNDISRLFGG
jgi:regulator of sigma E protease